MGSSLHCRHLWIWIHYLELKFHCTRNTQAVVSNMTSIALTRVKPGFSPACHDDSVMTRGSSSQSWSLLQGAIWLLGLLPPCQRCRRLKELGEEDHTPCPKSHPINCCTAYWMLSNHLAISSRKAQKIMLRIRGLRRKIRQSWKTANCPRHNA